MGWNTKGAWSVSVAAAWATGCVRKPDSEGADRQTRIMVARQPLILHTHLVIEVKGLNIRCGERKASAKKRTRLHPHKLLGPAVLRGAV